MGLEDSCKNYKDKLILIKPVFGWGWTSNKPDISIPNQVNGVPFSFYFRVKTYFYFENELRGAVGRVEDSNHIYNNLWAFFYNRNAGISNFTNKLPYCNIEISLEYPEIRNKWYEFKRDSQIIIGYCIAGESVQAIAEYERNLLA
jgi:hypothetical protein